ETFLAKLRETFKAAAGAHLQTMSRGLLELAKTPASAHRKPAEARQQSVEALVRAAHSLKGAARTVDLPERESLCQLLEDIFAHWTKTEIAQSPEALDTLHAALDAASSMLIGAPGDHNPKNSPSLRQALRQLASPAVTISSHGSTQHKVTEGSSDITG